MTTLLNMIQLDSPRPPLMNRLAYWAILAFVFSIPFETSITAGQNSLSRFIGVAVLGLSALALLERRHLYPLRVFHGLVLLYVLYGMSSYLWSWLPPRTFQYLQTYIQVVLWMMLAWQLVDTPSRFYRFLLAYVGGASVAVMSVLVRLADFYTLGTGALGRWNRFTAFGANANSYALTIALTVNIAWYLSHHFTDRRVVWFLRVYRVLAVVGVLLSGSRTGTLVALLGIMGSLVVTPRANLRTVLGSMIGVTLLAVVVFSLASAVLPASTLERILTTPTQVSTGDLTGREVFWEEGLRVFSVHPFWGIGLAAYPAITYNGFVAHSLYLSILVELGIIGALLYGGMMFNLIGQILRLPHMERNFLVVYLFSWMIGVALLTWEHDKSTWMLYISIMLASHCLTVPSSPNASVWNARPFNQV
ncbi:MAG: O-antigen ligase family protein [Phototrophicaceae bacterium]